MIGQFQRGSTLGFDSGVVAKGRVAVRHFPQIAEIGEFAGGGVPHPHLAVRHHPILRLHKRAGFGGLERSGRESGGVRQIGCHHIVAISIGHILRVGDALVPHFHRVGSDNFGFCVDKHAVCTRNGEAVQVSAAADHGQPVAHFVKGDADASGGQHSHALIHRCGRVGGAAVLQIQCRLIKAVGDRRFGGGVDDRVQRTVTVLIGQRQIVQGDLRHAGLVCVPRAGHILRLIRNVRAINMRRDVRINQRHFFIGKAEGAAPILLQQLQQLVIVAVHSQTGLALVPKGAGDLHTLAVFPAGERSDDLVVQGGHSVVGGRPVGIVIIFFARLQQRFHIRVAVDRLARQPAVDARTAGGVAHNADRHIQLGLQLHRKLITDGGHVFQLRRICRGAPIGIDDIKIGGQRMLHVVAIRPGALFQITDVGVLCFGSLRQNGGGVAISFHRQLHIGLAARNPQLADHDIGEGLGRFDRDGILIFNRQGVRRVGPLHSGQRHSEGVVLRRGRGGGRRHFAAGGFGQRSGHCVATRRFAPDVDGLVALEQHVIAKHIGEGQRGVREGGQVVHQPRGTQPYILRRRGGHGQRKGGYPRHRRVSRGGIGQLQRQRVPAFLQTGGGPAQRFAVGGGQRHRRALHRARLRQIHIGENFQILFFHRGGVDRQPAFLHRVGGAGRGQMRRAIIQHRHRAVFRLLHGADFRMLRIIAGVHQADVGEPDLKAGVILVGRQTVQPELERLLHIPQRVFDSKRSQHFAVVRRVGKAEQHAVPALFPVDFGKLLFGAPTHLMVRVVHRIIVLQR